jgi:GTP-binding protein Era
MDVFNEEAVISGIVALVGPPNAGKSTLLNCLLKQKISIVTPKPQTTRNRIAGIVNEKDYQIVFLDTPGLHRSEEPLNRELLRVAMESLKNVDGVVFMLDVSRIRPEKIRAQEQQELAGYFSEITAPALLILNKVDLVERTELLPIIESYSSLYPFRAIIPISALTGDGTVALLEELLSILPRGFRYFPEDIPTDATERFLVSEIIREKVFLQTGQEIPYSSAVLIESFKENDRGKVVIHAAIYVERGSQKGIVIGKEGKKLKNIGISARRDIEELLDHKVVLKLWVKVRKHWQRDNQFMKELGF